MEIVIIVLLVLLIFLISCDNSLLKTVKDYIWPASASDAVAAAVADAAVASGAAADAAAAVEGYSVSDELELGRRSGFLNNAESTTTWEPSTADFEKLGADKIYQSYAEDLKANVDRAVVESHREYTKETDFLATTGASHAAARDDFMPPVQFHGLPRKAHYANVGAETTSRTAQTETPDAVMDIRDHNSSGYVL